jgi:hypothetical protein
MNAAVATRSGKSPAGSQPMIGILPGERREALATRTTIILAACERPGGRGGFLVRSQS